MRTISKRWRLRAALVSAVALSGAALADLVVDEKGFATLIQIIGVGPSDTVFFKPELGKTGKSK